MARAVSRSHALSAIAGFWSFDGRPTDAPCSRMLQAQGIYGKHRAQLSDAEITLGRNLHRCLPEDLYDRAPLSRGPFRFVADVRIDNRTELIRELEMQSSEASRLPDSALLFEALLRWRERAADRIVGEFAFALWDQSDRSLLLGRDILGLRPLYYHRAPGFFAFASMPSGLHALDEVPYEPNLDFMVETLGVIPARGPSTHYAQIERVEPAHVARVTRQKTSPIRYWKPEQTVTARGNSADFEEGLRSVVEQAVSSHLRGVGDVVASQLSGGLDSSIVTTTAARLFPNGKVAAYTAAPRKGFAARLPAGVIADESAMAAETARLYQNIEHVIVESSGESPLEWLDRNFLYQQQPMANLANAVWGQAIHRQAKDRGANVILKASAGNLTASYSGLEWLPSLLSSGRLIELGKQVSGLVRNGMPLIAVGARTIGPFVPASIWRTLRGRKGKATGIMSFSAVNRRRVKEVTEKSAARGWDLAERPRRHPMENRLWAYARVDGGNAYKGVLGEWGLSVRDPTADRRVIEYCLSVPFDQFLVGGIPRSLARRAFSDRMPTSVSYSAVRGFQSADWHEALNDARHAIEQEISSIFRCKQAGDALDFGWLKDCLENWPSEGWEREDIRTKYRLGLLRGVSAGHFIRKVKGTN